jgi:hypothetical protein
MHHISIAIELADYWANSLKKPALSSLLSRDNPRLYAEFMALGETERKDAEDFALLVGDLRQEATA